MKKLICLIICTMLTISMATVHADIPKFHYSFEEAAKMALDNTPEYKGMDNEIDKAYDDFEALDKITPSDIKFTGSMKIFVERQVQPHVLLEGAYSKYQLLIMGRNNIKRNIELRLREAVIAIEKAEIAAKEAKIAKKAKNNELTLLEIRYEQGLIGKIDYNNEKKRLKDELKTFDDDIDKALDMTYRQLNLLLGREDEKDIVVNLNDTLIPLDKLDLKQIKKDMISNGKTATDYESASLRELKEQRYIQSYRYDLIKERYDKYDLDKFTDKMRNDIEDMYEEAKKDFEVADKKYNNALTRFEKTFDDLIKDIEDLYGDIKDIKNDIAIEKENIKIYKVKYDTGRMSKIEYDSLLDKITLLENKLKRAELDLNMKYAELLIYSDLKKVVLE